MRNFNIATSEAHRSEKTLIMTEFCHAMNLATFSYGRLRDPRLWISFPHREFYSYSEFYFYYKFYFCDSQKYFLGIVENATRFVCTHDKVCIYRLEICLKAWCTINAFIANAKAVIMNYIYYKIFVII